MNSVLNVERNAKNFPYIDAKEQFIISCIVVYWQNKGMYSSVLVNYLLSIMGQSCQYNSRIRPVTLEMASLVLKQLVWSTVSAKCFLQDIHLAMLEVSLS